MCDIKILGQFGLSALAESLNKCVMDRKKLSSRHEEKINLFC